MARNIEAIVNELDGPLFLIDAMPKKSLFLDALLDIGYLCYAAFNHSFLRRHKLTKILIEERGLKLAKKDTPHQVIHKISFVDIDTDGSLGKVWGHIIEGLAYDMIFVDTRRINSVVYYAHRRFTRFRLPGGTAVKAKWYENNLSNDRKRIKLLKNEQRSVYWILGPLCAVLATRVHAKKVVVIEVVAASILYLNNVLEARKKQTSKEIEASLPVWVLKNFEYFNEDKIHEVPPNRPGIDTEIKRLRYSNSRESKIPFIPSYNMSRDELLLPKKTLKNFLDQN